VTDSGKARAAAASPLAAITRWVAFIREYRRAVNELDALTDHDLRDLGIARDAIARTAWYEALRASAPHAQDRNSRTPPAAAATYRDERHRGECRRGYADRKRTL
jgi:uncharacterized protein YjiS (DUF1127 family)